MRFFKELGGGLLAIVAMTLGLLLIAVFFEVAVEESSEWWNWPIAFGLALTVTGVALFLIGGAAVYTCVEAALGWTGMLAGYRPEGFDRRAGNRTRAIADLMLFVLCGYLGLRLFRHGAAEGALNWAIEGLFFAGAGVVFGLLPLVPRLYFELSRKGRGAPRQPRRERGAKRAQAESGDDKLDRKLGDGVVVLVGLAALGIGLSMAVTNTTATLRMRDGRATLAYGDWADGCVGEIDCPSEEARLTIVAKRSGLIRVEYLGDCEFELLDGDGGKLPTIDIETMARLGVPAKRYGEKDRASRVFEAASGRSYQVRVTGKCAFYSVRYFAERTGARAAAESEGGR